MKGRRRSLLGHIRGDVLVVLAVVYLVSAIPGFYREPESHKGVMFVSQKYITVETRSIRNSYLCWQIPATLLAVNIYAYVHQGYDTTQKNRSL